MFSSRKTAAPSSGGYSVGKSLRFRSSASAYLNRTPASASNRTTFTYSVWFKRGILGTDQDLLVAGSNTTGQQNFQFGFRSSTADVLQVVGTVSGSAADLQLFTTQVFRDPSAWYHAVVVIDTTQATAANRAKLYINGAQVTAFSSSTYPAQNYAAAINNNVAHTICRFANVSANFFDGYLAEVNFIDGQALTPSSFGAYDTNGVWQPINYSGSYGTNGFHLTFGNTTSTATLGNDSSGNSNNWTTNNISLTAGSTYDSMTDSPTVTSASVANYAVINPLGSASADTYSQGNLKWTKVNNTTNSIAIGSIAISSGKWYWEGTVAGAGGSNLVIGLGNTNTNFQNLDSNLGMTGSTTSYGYNGGVGPYKQNNNTQTSYGASYTTNDIIGVAFDADSGTLTFYKNNTSQGTAFTGITGTYYPACAGRFTGDSWYMNFGQQPFNYTPPTGFKALNTYNLPTPTIANGAQYMAATTYTGNGSTQSINNGNNTTIATTFQPDFVWIKSRSDALGHRLLNSITGVYNYLISNSTLAESTDTTSLTAFNSNGFSLGAAAANGFNTNGSTYVGWQWKANGSGVSNTNGSITSTVSANTTAGFSVVTYTGNGTAGATIGHGLGVAPSMVIIKSRSGVRNWQVYHISIGNTGAVFLNTTGATSTATTNWNNTSPTSSVVSLGTDGNVNANTETYVAYCFAAVAGYSAFGSYTGNASTDGTFVYTGFRPRWVMMKRTDAAGFDWNIVDTSRNLYNVTTARLWADLANAEDATDNVCDITSNGFKLRSTNTNTNASGGTYIYMAFAENPFNSSRAR